MNPAQSFIPAGKTIFFHLIRGQKVIHLPHRFESSGQQVSHACRPPPFDSGIYRLQCANDLIVLSLLHKPGLFKVFVSGPCLPHDSPEDKRCTCLQGLAQIRHIKKSQPDFSASVCTLKM